MTHPFDRPFIIESRTGASLNSFHAPAPGVGRAILLVNHGMVEHAARYRDFAADMAARGFQVYAHDHRGHGATNAPDAPTGQFAAKDGWRKVLADTKAVRDHAVAHHEGLPVILFGHSMGGLVALNAALSYPQDFDALAIWNANFNAGLAGRGGQAVLAAERMLKGSDVPSALLPRLTFEAWGKAIENRRTEFDWLSHDPAKVQAYIDDPLCGWDASVSMWRDVFHLVFRGAGPRDWASLPRSLPIHLLAGGQDPATANGEAIRWLGSRLKAAGFQDVGITVEDEMRHETLNEIGAERPIAAFAAWMDGVVARRDG